MHMRKHWSVDENLIKKDSKQYAIWKLEERINNGVGEQKINKVDLITYWKEIVIDSWKRKALASALGLTV